MGIKFIGIKGNRDCYSPQQVNSCTVGEFIAYLSEYDEDMPLYLVNDNGYTYGSLSRYDIDEHYINDDGELDGEMDEEDLDECQLYTKESYSDVKYVGKTWKDFIDSIEYNSEYVVDSSERSIIGSRHDSVLLFKPGSDKLYIGEVTRYSDGTYELMDYNIHPTRIGESCNESHRIRKNKLFIKRTYKHPKLMK